MRTLARRCRIYALGVLVALLALAACSVPVALSDDAISSTARMRIERAVNGYLEDARQRAAVGHLRIFDRFLLHAGVVLGSAVGEFISPEGVAVLLHAVYGDGSPLALDPTYFKDDPFVAAQVRKLGPGVHGPIWVRQEDDWRLSLALNPVYLDVAPTRVRLGHPLVKFARPEEKPVYTIVPIGKLRIRVPDNLVGSLGPTPFEAWAEWNVVPRHEGKHAGQAAASNG